MSRVELMERLASHVDRLPPMPSNVVKLRQAIANPNVNYRMIVPLVKEDPSICASLLKIANSARYGVAHHVETVEEAVRYFGMPALADFISAACSEKIVRQTFSNISNLNEYLVHSRTISRSTLHICAALGLDQHSQEVYSVSGLLHDIGRLVILLVSGEKRYSKEFFGSSWEEMSSEAASESDLYGLNHADLGMRICAKWQFPEKIVRAVHRHHTPLLGNDLSYEGLVIFLSEVIAIDEIPDSVVLKALPDELMKGLNLAPDALLKARRDFQESPKES